MFQQSKACCNTLPFQLEWKSFNLKGEMKSVDGTETYVTGSDEATHGLMVIYDIFGFYPQTLQGADILATSDSRRKYKVFMPDFFEGEPAKYDWYPPDSPEKEKLLDDFFKGPAVLERNVDRLQKIHQHLIKEHPKITTWGLVGYCWGGYIASYACVDKSPFSAVAELHPGFVGAEIAKRISIPVLALISFEDPLEDKDPFESNVKGEFRYEVFKDQIHGWMSARGNLNDPHVKAEYERGYKIVSDFFFEKL